MKMLIPLAIAVAVAATPAEAAPAASSSRTVTVEINEVSPQGKSSAARFDAVVTLDRGNAHLRAQVGDSLYDVEIEWRSDRGAAPLLEVEFSEMRDGKAPTKIDAHARAELNRKMSIGAISRPDGGRFDLAVTLR